MMWQSVSWLVSHTIRNFLLMPNLHFLGFGPALWANIDCTSLYNSLSDIWRLLLSLPPIAKHTPILYLFLTEQKL